MLPVSVARRAREPQNYHVRAEMPDRPDHIGENAVMSPLGHRLLGRFGESEVNGPREKLLGAVDAAGRQKLLCTDDAQKVTLLRTDEVLPAFSASRRKVSRASFPAAGEIGEQSGVLV